MHTVQKDGQTLKNKRIITLRTNIKNNIHRAVRIVRIIMIAMTQQKLPDHRDEMYRFTGTISYLLLH